MKYLFLLAATFVTSSAFCQEIMKTKEGGILQWEGTNYNYPISIDIIFTKNKIIFCYETPREYTFDLFEKNKICMATNKGATNCAFLYRNDTLYKSTNSFNTFFYH